MLLYRLIMKESNYEQLGGQEELLEEEKLLEIERQHPVYQAIISYLLEEAFKTEKDPQYIKREEIHEWLNSLLEEEDD